MAGEHDLLQEWNAEYWQLDETVFKSLLDMYDNAKKVQTSDMAAFNAYAEEVKRLCETQPQEERNKYNFDLFQTFDEIYFNCSGEFWRTAFQYTPAQQFGLMTFVSDADEAGASEAGASEAGASEAAAS